MVFKRRKQLSWPQWLVESVYPRSGWRRASSYIAHRLRRLPDTPQKIARGIGVGVYVSFTPFFGFHFLVATALAIMLRGNVIAALLATFFGNPLTFPLIATGSLTLGHKLLGLAGEFAADKSIFQLFKNTAADFLYNFKALFTAQQADWSGLDEFFFSVFVPYLVGGMIPGIAFGVTAYLLSRPVISAYQKRRKGHLMARWKQRRANARKKADQSR